MHTHLNNGALATVTQHSSPTADLPLCPLQTNYVIVYFAPLIAVAVGGLFTFWLVLYVRRWSVNLLSIRIIVAFVVATSSLFLSGFARDDTEKVATWVDGRLTFVPDPNPTFSNDDPGDHPVGVYWA